MPLVKATILTAALANLTAAGFTTSPTSTNGLFVKAVVDAIVDAITTTAIVTTIVTGTLPPGPVAAVGTGIIT